MVGWILVVGHSIQTETTYLVKIEHQVEFTNVMEEFVEYFDEIVDGF